MIKIHVYDDNICVGELKAYSNEYFEFSYTPHWTKNNPNAFAIDSQLPLSDDGNAKYTNNTLWCCFADISPDRWGRIIQSRNIGRALSDVEYMLGVSDYYRIGSLRLKMGDEFIAKENNFPKLIHINEIMQSSFNVENEEYTNSDIESLLGVGSSIGGARPKACFIDNNKLYLAKFPSINDEYSVILWEKTMLDLASIAGIEVPNTKIIDTKFNKKVLLIERFDREYIQDENGLNTKRIPFMSAMSLLHVSERESADEKSYIDVARNLHTNDKQKLFRRMVFNTLFGNTDDHLRNHALLYDKNTRQWNLSPAYDLNPNPLPYEKQIHALKFTANDNKPSIELCISIKEEFEVDSELCNKIITDCFHAGLKYQEIALKNGIKQAEIKFMSGNFEHKDMEIIKSMISRDKQQQTPKIKNTSKPTKPRSRR